MRRITAKLAALAMLVGCGGMLLAQKGGDENKDPSKPDPKKPAAKKPAAPGLDDLLAEALRNNPDIHVAQAKLHEADAQLNRARLQVMQKIVAYHHNLEAQKAQVAAAELDFRRLSELAQKAVISEHLVRTAAASLAAAKSRLAEIEAELPYLLGKQPARADAKTQAELSRRTYLQQLHYLHALSQAQSAWKEMANEDERVAVRRALQWLGRVQATDARLQGTATDKIRKALETPVSLKIGEAKLDDVFTYLEDRVPDITLRVITDKRRDIKNLTIELQFKKPIPLGAALQAIQDSVPNLAFAVREYGVLVAWSDQLPPDAVLVQDFWKGGAAKKPDGSGDGAPRTAKKNPPPNQVNGEVTQLNSTGLVTINLGSDAGLMRGHTLEVFRLKPRPLYLGTIEIIAITGDHAVGKPLGATFKDKVKPGDRVASKVHP